MSEKKETTLGRPKTRVSHLNRIKRTAPSLWKGKSYFPDRRDYLSEVKVSTLQNTLIDLVTQNPLSRGEMANKTGIHYDVVVRHVRLLIEDEVLTDINGMISIAPLEVN